MTAPTPPPPAKKPAGNVLTRKYGPLPGYAWAGIAAAGGFFLLHRASSSSTPASSSSGSSTDDSGTVAASDQGIDSSGYDPTDPGSYYTPDTSGGADTSGSGGYYPTDYGQDPDAGLYDDGSGTTTGTAIAAPPAPAGARSLATTRALKAERKAAKKDTRAANKLTKAIAAAKAQGKKQPAGSIAKGTRVITARAGDTVAKVAKRYGITVAQLRKDNPSLKGKTKLHAGERVHV